MLVHPTLLNFGLPPGCPQVVWCHWREIEPFSATLAQDGLAECDQSEKNPLKYSAMAGNWTRATGRTDSELSHWAIMTIIILHMITVLCSAYLKLIPGYSIFILKSESRFTLKEWHFKYKRSSAKTFYRQGHKHLLHYKWHIHTWLADQPH